MTDTKPLPSTANAEGETAALQAQVVNIGTLDKDSASKDTSRPTHIASDSKKDADAGFKNYIASKTSIVNIL